MKLSLALVLILLPTIWAADKCPDFNQEITWQIEFCKNPYSADSCIPKIENRQLKKHSSYVWRSGDTLALKLESGDTLLLKNDRVDGEGTTVHYLRHYCRDLGYFLVYRGYYEGFDYLLINDRTGKQTTLREIPVLSPDARRLVTTVTDLVADYLVNGIQIWRFTDHDLVLEWSFDSGGLIGYSNAVWADSATIGLYRVEWEGHDYKRTPLVLTKGGESWELREK
ncbi:MAG: hypothetical protein A2142_07545 [candidate division Zixibacteria bacterium RBG_16_48_11]|nr:MAG: hypothetical protein A2142_07545 [candidate division Zixibacteria bacterium RBG_16_48_11]